MRAIEKLDLRWALGALLVFGCSDREPATGSGNARVEVSASALSAGDVAKVIVTVSGAHISPDIVRTLAGGPSTGWSGTITDIPAGMDRVFVAQAFNAAEVLLYAGTAPRVTIADHVTTSVAIFLQQVTPPDPFKNSVPRFTSLVISDETVAPTQTITLAVTAVDPDPGDTLTYAWKASDGALGSPGAATTTWTAPSMPGPYKLVVTATDRTGAKATLSVGLDVETYNGSGNALVNGTLNTWPVVANLVTNPTRIDVGQTTHLDLTASDPDGDQLSYAWTAECGLARSRDPVLEPAYGTFDDPNAEDPSFTLHRLPDTGVCTLAATISDGRGGTNTASVTIETGPGLGSSSAAESPRDCANGLDDDGDGLIDCADPDCDRAVCRGPTGECDAVERCNQGVCPPDGFLSSLTICRAARGACDQAEACTGTGPRCPEDTVKRRGTMCRDLAGPCDVAELCDGVSAECPADLMAGPEVVCRRADGVCDRAEQCTGVSPRCPIDQAAKAGTECRPVAGPCDLAESCDGVSHKCPEDRYRGSIRSGDLKDPLQLSLPVICRPSTGACDPAEACTGLSPDCPPDQLRPSGYVCRLAAGTCDTVAELCDGASPACPPDLNRCSTGQFCNGDACVAKLANAQACSSNGQCQSAHCIDGVCCDSACTGECQACNLPNSVGTCAAHSRGTDPEGACEAYNCDGSGGCIYGSSSHGGAQHICSSAGDCKPQYYCLTTGLPDGAFASSCEPDRPPGSDCVDDSQCGTGHCANGVCCDTACTGGCEACSSSGVCTALPRGTDPKNACGAYNCSGNSDCVRKDDVTSYEACRFSSDCKQDYYCYIPHPTGCTPENPCSIPQTSCEPDLPKGSACSDGNQCSTGYCADGVCCEGACTGGCEACNLAGHIGTCTPRARGTDPELACGAYDCSGTGVCLQSGDGASSTSCDADTDCKPGFHCYRYLGGNQYPMAECEADVAQTNPCTHDSQCTTGHCVDGVCCNTACNSLCQSCSVPGHVGTCFNYPQGSDPDNECGLFVCSGSGSCVTQCTPRCGNPGLECKYSAWCDNGTCVPDKQNVSGCWDGCQCTSNSCVPNPAYAGCVGGFGLFGAAACALAGIPLMICM